MLHVPANCLISMKIDCWCFTCIIGASEPDDAEESLLIPGGDTPTPTNEDVLQTCPEVQNDSSGVVDSEPSMTERRSGNTLTVNNHHEDIDAVFSSEGDSKSSDLHSPTSPNVSCKNEENNAVSRNISLKIAVKVMAQSELVKVFAVSATGVSDSLVDENSFSNKDNGGADQQTMSVVQLRTKLLPSETRGHSKKYDATENILGALKFGNDCLHQITMDDFRQFSLRLRLYQILKQFHQRDKLLGEYILDFTSLGLAEDETCTHNIIMRLHDPSATDVEPPDISSTVGGSISGQDDGGSARVTLGRSRSKVSRKLTIPEFSGSESIQEDDVSGKAGSGGKKVQKQHSTGSGRKSIISFTEGTDKARHSVFNQLSQKTRERHSKVSELGNASEEMHNNARNFAQVSRRLSERYERKAKKGF